MAVDFTPVLDALGPLVDAVVTVAVPILVAAVLRKFKLDKNAQLVSLVTTACDAGAGAAYKFAASSTQGLRSVEVHNAALSVGLSHVINSVPDAMAALGLTPEHVKAMVSARLGTLLAADPNVSVGSPAPVEPAASDAPKAA